MAHLSTPRLPIPNEILVLIFSNFCPHCQDAYNESWDQRPLQPLTSQQKKQSASAKPFYSVDRQTLCSLSLTCRQFRDVAQSVLYHEFVLGYGDSWKSEVYRWEDRLAPFIRTLARRPDLARNVKVVYISHRILATSEDKEDKEESRRNILLEAANALGVDLPASWKEREEDVDLRCTRINAELIAMLLAQTPNTEIIGIQSSRGWPTCGVPDSSMPALGVTHLPVKRLDLGMLAHPIIKISDNLETLNFHGYIGNLGHTDMELPCLKTLTITDGFLTAVRLSKVLDGCTGSLVAFEYEAGPRRRQNSDTRAMNFSLSNAIQLLRPHRSTLRILHMDLTARRQDIRRLEPGVNMRDFTALQHLWVNNSLLLFPIVPPMTLGTPTDGENLVQFLPHSIISLEIYRHMRFNTVDALEGLVAVKSEKFPFLSEVIFGPRGQRDPGRACRAAGVNFSKQICRLSRAKTYLQGPDTSSRPGTPEHLSSENRY